METTKRTPQNSPAFLRAVTPFGLAEGNADPEKRIIKNYAVITRGEALGHRMWIDEVFLDQVVTAGNQAPHGIKSRFTHPDLCSSGLGTFLGRARRFRRDGDVVRADLHFSDVTKTSPTFDKDPARYIMALTADDPHAFGTSIVFRHDVGAEDRFIAEHEDEEGDFTSPDPDNDNNFYHARLAALRASDIVDSPGANPGGFLSDGQEQAAAATTALEYAFGLTENDPPPGTFGGIEPERARTFISTFLANHELAVTPIPTFEEANMPPEKKTQEVLTELRTVDPESKTPRSAREHLKALREAFPEDDAFVLKAIEDELSVEDARGKFVDVLRTRLAEKDAEIEKFKVDGAVLQVENDGIKEELLDGAEPSKHASTPGASDFMSKVTAHKKVEKCSYEDAVRAVIEADPEGYERHRAGM